MAVFHILSCLALLAYGKSVPPQVCFEPFNWGDCGRPPVHVLYYYKSGSRCEVGVWRGCLPNLNMFKDEYECVNTCVFVERARPEDYHNMMAGGEGISPDIGVTDAHNPLSTDEPGHEADQNITSDYEQKDSEPVDKEEPTDSPQKPEIDANTDPHAADATEVPPVDATLVPPVEATSVPPVDATVVPPLDATTVPPIDVTAVPPIDNTPVTPVDTSPVTLVVTTPVPPADRRRNI